MMRYKRTITSSLFMICVVAIGLQVKHEVIADQGEEGTSTWTLSAMALHLLRTLESDHQQNNVVGAHLIPCCGHHIDHLENEPDVHVQGCFTGINYWVTHEDGKVSLETEQGTKAVISFEAYKNQVVDFADRVEAFYDQSKPRQFPEDEYDPVAYQKFWREWERRRQR